METDCGCRFAKLKWTLNDRSANHPFSQSVDWNAKGAAQRGRTEWAVLPARRSAPEHNPCMTSEYRTAAKWIRLGINFEEGGNRSTRRKPGLRLKLNPHTTFVVEVEGVIDIHNTSLTSHGVQHRVFYLDDHPSRYPPRLTGNRYFPLVIAVTNFKALGLISNHLTI